MSVIEHLEELRYRLVISVLAIVAGAVIAYFLYNRLLDFLLHPLTESGEIGDLRVVDDKGNPQVYVPGVTTAFYLRIKLSGYAGFVFALPVVLYQLWRFITPGLHPREKRYAVPFVGSALILFGVGTFLAFLFLPLGLRFLLEFVPPAQPLIHLTEYLNFTIFMILAFGLAFQFPLALVFLGMIGVLPASALAKRRRMAFVLAFIVSALITPSGDPLTQSILAGAMYLLYEISILVIRFVLKR